MPPIPKDISQRLAKRKKRRSPSPIPSPRKGKVKEFTTATLTDGDEVVSEVKFLIEGWVPLDMVTGIVAEPGVGKSAFVMGGIVLPLLTGKSFFDGSPGLEPKNVLWCGTENDLAITVDRARKWGVPFDRFYLPFDDPLASIDLTNDEHLERVETIVNKFGIQLVVIDSLRGGHDGDENNSRVGKVLKSLSEIAARTHVAVVVIHHTRKLMVDEEITANSSRGSNAILAMMRSQIGIDRPDHNSDSRRIRVLKENLGIAPKPVGYCITDKGLEFGTAPERRRRETQKDEAAEFLRGRMKPGKAYKVAELMAEAAQYGHSERTVRKAATEILHIKPKPIYRDGKIAEWRWQLPTGRGKSRESRPLDP